MKHQYYLTITDLDGEEHEYRLLAKNAYYAAYAAWDIGKQYGHDITSAVCISIEQWVDSADRKGAIDTTVSPFIWHSK